MAGNNSQTSEYEISNLPSNTTNVRSFMHRNVMRFFYDNAEYVVNYEHYCPCPIISLPFLKRMPGRTHLASSLNAEQPFPEMPQVPIELNYSTTVCYTYIPNGMKKGINVID